MDTIKCPNCGHDKSQSNGNCMKCNTPFDAPNVNWRKFGIIWGLIGGAFSFSAVLSYPAAWMVLLFVCSWGLTSMAFGFFGAGMVARKWANIRVTKINVVWGGIIGGIIGGAAGYISLVYGANLSPYYYIIFPCFGVADVIIIIEGLRWWEKASWAEIRKSG